jgi:SAM-dependent methyltransferase
MPTKNSTVPEPPSSSGRKPDRWQNAALLFMASFVSLYFELVVIRYLSTEIRVFAYIQNLPLIASFLGLGAGMIINRPMRGLRRAFPFLTATLFLLIAYASVLGITRLPFGGRDVFVWEQSKSSLPPGILALRYVGVTLGITALVVVFFVVLGRIVGDYLARHRPLPGYGLNLTGSLVGIGAFTVVSFLGLPPAVWILIGFVAALPFFVRNRIALICFAVVVVAIPRSGPYTFWSPYYHISLSPEPPPAGLNHPAAYLLTVNHDYHQKIVDLSPSFLNRFPDAEPNRSSRLTYNLPYEFVTHPDRVLIVGAGTGNDVAAAERYGARDIDAVEIDPVIQRIGKKYHPERPYDSPTVHVHINDARAFFKEAPKNSYDLVEFAYLDSHTLFASLSSLRLDNYVYTLESFEEAKSLLKPGGYLVLAFAGGRSFVTDRLFATLTRAFQRKPLAFQTDYDKSGIVFVERLGESPDRIAAIPEISTQLAKENVSLLATDDWPFLYQRSRTISLPIILILIPFLLGAYVLLRDTGSLPSVTTTWSQHLFLLGAGFLLLETRAVTVLALLFGSTWIVNAVVISAFLAMALLANTLVSAVPVARKIAYPLLFASLLVSLYFPYGRLNVMHGLDKVLAAGLIFAVPVFLSGLVFSRSFQGAAAPSAALGVNLLGAVVGGILENFVTIGGTALLGYLAILIYALSAVALLLYVRVAEQRVPNLKLAD